MQQFGEKRRFPALPSWVRAHDDRRSELFTYVCFALAPMAGALVSIAVNVGAVGGVLEVLRGTVRLSRDRFMVCLAVPLYLYGAAYLVALAANPNPDWKYALPAGTLLLFPFLYSSWSLSRHETIARSAVLGSMAACFGALLLAVVQFHFLGMRAEGGDGNAIVFAVVTTLAALISLAGAFGRTGFTATLLFAAYCAGSIAVLYSGSRTAWLALFVASGVILWIYRDRRHAWKSTFAISCAAVGIVMVSAVATVIVPTRIDALIAGLARDQHRRQPRHIARQSQTTLEGGVGGNRRKTNPWPRSPGDPADHPRRVRSRRTGGPLQPFSQRLPDRVGRGGHRRRPVADRCPRCRRFGRRSRPCWRRRMKTSGSARRYCRPRRSSMPSMARPPFFWGTTFSTRCSSLSFVSARTSRVAHPRSTRTIATTDVSGGRTGSAP